MKAYFGLLRLTPWPITVHVSLSSYEYRCIQPFDHGSRTFFIVKMISGRQTTPGMILPSSAMCLRRLLTLSNYASSSSPGASLLLSMLAVTLLPSGTPLMLVSPTIVDISFVAIGSLQCRWLLPSATLRPLPFVGLFFHFRSVRASAVYATGSVSRLWLFSVFFV